MNKKLFTYKKSGVNINAADNFVNFIRSVSSKKKRQKKVFQYWWIWLDIKPSQSY